MALVINKKIKLAPDSWQSPLNTPCKQCAFLLRSIDSISLCDCPLYCHEKCFIKKLQPEIQKFQHIECGICDKQIELNLAVSNICVLEKTFLCFFTIFLIIAGMIILLALWATGKKGRLFIPNEVAYGVSGGLFILLVLSLVFFLRKRIIHVKGVSGKQINDTRESLGKIVSSGKSTPRSPVRKVIRKELIDNPRK